MTNEPKAADGKAVYEVKTCVITSSVSLANRLTDEIGASRIEVRPSLGHALREPAPAYVVDTQVEDISIWPAPLLMDPEAKEKPWLFLVADANDIPPMEESPRECAFFGREEEDAASDIRTYLERRLASEAGRRFHKVDYIRQARMLIVHFENGKCYALDLNVVEGADETEAAKWEIVEGQDCLIVTQQSGNVLEIPWDAVLHHCEREYEYYKGREQAESPQARAERIGASVRNARERLGLTSTELAERCGIRRPNLSRLEGGKHVPSLETLERIAESLDVPVARLLAR